MLIGNRSVLLKSPGRNLSGTVACIDRSNFSTPGALRNAFDALAGYPYGYGQKSWFLPKRAGAMSSTNNTRVETSASGLAVGGITSPGAASIAFTVADAAGQLISSGSGSASLTFTLANALLTASVGGSGSASLSITPTALLGALASGQGSAGFTVSIANAQAYPLNDASPLRDGTASFAITGALTPYAIGSMNGSTVDSSVLTVDAIAGGVWSALAAQYTEGTTMGGKLNTASAGGVDLSALAQAVWEYAQRNVNVTHMNGATVVGTGQVGDAWRGPGVQP